MLLGLGTSNYLPFVLNFLDILYCGAKVVLLKYKPNPDRLQVKTLEWLLKCTPYLEPGSEWFLPHSLLILPSRFWIFKHDSLLRTSSPLGLRLYIIMYQYSQSLHALVTTSLSGAWFSCDVFQGVPIIFVSFMKLFSPPSSLPWWVLRRVDFIC